MKEYFTFSYWRDQVLSFGHALCTVKFWKELLMMTIGMSLGAAAVYYFLMPSHLIVGSISGLSIVFNTLYKQVEDLINNHSVPLYDLFRQRTGESG